MQHGIGTPIFYISQSADPRHGPPDNDGRVVTAGGQVHTVVRPPHHIDCRVVARGNGQQFGVVGLVVLGTLVTNGGDGPDPGVIVASARRKTGTVGVDINAVDRRSTAVVAFVFDPRRFFNQHVEAEGEKAGQ